jgi:peptidoglycan/xylan/chitin deacetylase (PgdA/CDA1 family)
MGQPEGLRGVRRALAFAAGLTALAAFACATSAGGAGTLSTGCRSTNSIALTFDDGPNPPYTGAILDVLAGRNAPATFFVVGTQVEAHPDLARRERDAGMTIASHSYAHRDDYPSMSQRAFGEDLVQAEQSISSVTGESPRLYRAPHGNTNKSMGRELRARGYASIGWDIDARDWDPSTTSDQIVSNVLDNAHAGGIVLLHDGGLSGGDPDRSRTIAALPQIVDGLRDRGYTLVTVPQLTGLPETAGGTRSDVCSAS